MKQNYFAIKDTETGCWVTEDGGLTGFIYQAKLFANRTAAERSAEDGEEVIGVEVTFTIK